MFTISRFDVISITERMMVSFTDIQLLSILSGPQGAVHAISSQ